MVTDVAAAAGLAVYQRDSGGLSQLKARDCTVVFFNSILSCGKIENHALPKQFDEQKVEEKNRVLHNKQAIILR